MILILLDCSRKFVQITFTQSPSVNGVPFERTTLLRGITYSFQMKFPSARGLSGTGPLGIVQMGHEWSVQFVFAFSTIRPNNGSYGKSIHSNGKRVSFRNDFHKSHFLLSTKHLNVSFANETNPNVNYTYNFLQIITRIIRQ